MHFIFITNLKSRISSIGIWKLIVTLPSTANLKSTVTNAPRASTGSWARLQRKRRSMSRLLNHCTKRKLFKFCSRNKRMEHIPLLSYEFMVFFWANNIARCRFFIFCMCGERWILEGWLVNWGHPNAVNEGLGMYTLRSKVNLKANVCWAKNESSKASDSS